jgi:hypothetical protein
MKSATSIGLTLAVLFTNSGSCMADDFDKAYRETESQSINYDNPVSIQDGIGRWSKLLERFPEHPRAPEVRLRIYNILRVTNTAESLKQAGPVIRKLADQADPSTEFGRKVLLSYADYHLKEVRSPPLQDLKDCEARLQKLDELSRNDPGSLLYVQTASRLVLLRVRRGDLNAAIDTAIERLTAVTNLSPEAVQKLESDPDAYQVYLLGVDDINSSACEAIASSPNRALSQKLLDRPDLLDKYEMLRDCVERRKLQPDATPLTDTSPTQGNRRRLRWLTIALTGVILLVILITRRHRGNAAQGGVLP